MEHAHGRDGLRRRGWTSQDGRLHVSSQGTVLYVRGEVDPATAPVLVDALLDAEQLDGAGIVVDLADVTFMDASGLSALVAVRERLRRDGRGPMTVQAASAPVHRLFELTGLGDLLVPPT